MPTKKESEGGKTHPKNKPRKKRSSTYKGKAYNYTFRMGKPVARNRQQEKEQQVLHGISQQQQQQQQAFLGLQTEYLKRKMQQEQFPPAPPPIAISRGDAKFERPDFEKYLDAHGVMSTEPKKITEYGAELKRLMGIYNQRMRAGDNVDDIKKQMGEIDMEQRKAIDKVGKAKVIMNQMSDYQQAIERNKESRNRLDNFHKGSEQSKRFRDAKSQIAGFFDEREMQKEYKKFQEKKAKEKEESQYVYVTDPDTGAMSRVREQPQDVLALRLNLPPSTGGGISTDHDLFGGGGGSELLIPPSNNQVITELPENFQPDNRKGKHKKSVSFTPQQESKITDSEPSAIPHMLEMIRDETGGSTWSILGRDGGGIAISSPSTGSTTDHTLFGGGGGAPELPPTTQDVDELANMFSNVTSNYSEPPPVIKPPILSLPPTITMKKKQVERQKEKAKIPEQPPPPPPPPEPIPIQIPTAFLPNPSTSQQDHIPDPISPVFEPEPIPTSVTSQSLVPIILPSSLPNIPIFPQTAAREHERQLFEKGGGGGGGGGVTSQELTIIPPATLSGILDVRKPQEAFSFEAPEPAKGRVTVRKKKDTGEWLQVPSSDPNRVYIPGVNYDTSNPVFIAPEVERQIRRDKNKLFDTPPNQEGGALIVYEHDQSRVTKPKRAKDPQQMFTDRGPFPKQDIALVPYSGSTAVTPFIEQGEEMVPLPAGKGRLTVRKQSSGRPTALGQKAGGGGGGGGSSTGNALYPPLLHYDTSNPQFVAPEGDNQIIPFEENQILKKLGKHRLRMTKAEKIDFLDVMQPLGKQRFADPVVAPSWVSLGGSSTGSPAGSSPFASSSEYLNFSAGSQYGSLYSDPVGWSNVSGGGGGGGGEPLRWDEY